MKSQAEKILKFAGMGGIDEKAIEELKVGWKKWRVNDSLKIDFKIDKKHFKEVLKILNKNKRFSNKSKKQSK